MVRNRSNPHVVSAFRFLLQDENVLMSHDRWCLYRPTLIPAHCATPPGTPPVAADGDGGASGGGGGGTIFADGASAEPATTEAAAAVAAYAAALPSPPTAPSAGQPAQPVQEPALQDMPHWRTRGNLHLDLNPWTYESDATPMEVLG